MLNEYNHVGTGLAQTLPPTLPPSFLGGISLYIPGCPGTCFLDQANLELTEIHLCLPLLSAGIKGVQHST